MTASHALSQLSYGPGFDAPLRPDVGVRRACSLRCARPGPPRPCSPGRASARVAECRAARGRGSRRLLIIASTRYDGCTDQDAKRRIETYEVSNLPIFSEYSLAPSFFERGLQYGQRGDVFGAAGAALDLDQGFEIEDVQGMLASYVDGSGGADQVVVGLSVVDGSEAVEVSELGFEELMAGAQKVGFARR